jgi:hypothetical protein
MGVCDSARFKYEHGIHGLFLTCGFHRTYIHGKRIPRGYMLYGNWLLHYNVTTVLQDVDYLITLQQGWYFCCKFLFETHALFEQCTYLGYFLLEAPHEYVQHGPLLSINWLRLCPQSGARVRSHAVQRRLFIVLNDRCSHFTQCLFPTKLP